MRPRINVLFFPGTNCEAETIRAFARVGAQPRLLFMRDVITANARLDDSDILCIPGGFSYGDHLGAGRVAALMLTTRLGSQLAACRLRPLLGICNGFQILLRAGLFGVGAVLAENDSGRFRNVPEQEHVVALDSGSVWLDGLAGQRLTFPCAHGEGRFVYATTDGWRPALTYPEGQNVDGSMDDIAGITTPDGLVLGIMNHPERAANDERNLTIFENGVRAARC